MTLDDIIEDSIEMGLPFSLLPGSVRIIVPLILVEIGK